MSKSIGNVIDPLEITKQMGSDVLRLWVASSDYKDNVRISQEILQQVAKDYTNIRNRLRFIIGNLAHYDGSKPELEQYHISIVGKVSSVYEDIKKYYEANDYSKIIKTLITELNTGSIQHILDHLKDVLYVYPKTHTRWYTSD
jgi:isoleucyl-tRNA synthetase